MTTARSPSPSNGVKGEQEVRECRPPPLLSSPCYSQVLAASLVVSLVLITCFTTPILQPLQQMYETVGHFCQHQYHHIALLAHNDPFNLYVVVTMLVDYVSFWVVGSLYIVMDLSGCPASLRRFKVQPGTNEPLNYSSLFKLVLLVNANQLLVQLPSVWGIHHIMLARGADLSPSLPHLITIIVHIVIISIIGEFVFYYTHRLFHHRLLYRHIHKIHHTWQSPVAVSASYAHPIEHLVSNVLPVYTGLVLLGSHPFTVWLYVAVGNVYTLAHHSGYHLPFLPSPQFHDYHHLKFTECYGALGFLDHFHGTDHKFRKSVNFLRHRIFYSLTPPSAQVAQSNCVGKSE